MHVEARLAELIGPAAGRLHTARSRNDQVATDFRLWVRDAIDAITDGLRAFAQALIARADEHAGTVRSEEHTSELQSLMRNSYAVFCLKKKKQEQTSNHPPSSNYTNQYMHYYK